MFVRSPKSLTCKQPAKITGCNSRRSAWNVLVSVTMRTSLALVHHANQYLITDGYDNREGISDIVGSEESGMGMLGVLAMHAAHKVPLNLHISGTLLEAVAWHCPSFIPKLREYLETGLIEVVGSSYGQNIMRFFGPDYNRRQLNEELYLYQTLLGVDPSKVKDVLASERVWETRAMAPVLRDAALFNEGYRYVILDDRTLLSHATDRCPAQLFDKGTHWTPDVYQSHEIENGMGLIALPIATRCFAAFLRNRTRTGAACGGNWRRCWYTRRPSRKAICWLSMPTIWRK
jgi:hypothetical protein